MKGYITCIWCILPSANNPGTFLLEKYLSPILFGPGGTYN